MKRFASGSIYIMALAAAVVLTATVLGLSWLVIQFRHGSTVATNIEQAAIHAELGLRHALHFTGEVDNWRDLLESGPWLQDVAAGDAVYSVAGMDPVDGDLANDDGAIVQLTAVATVNGVTRALRVDAEQAALPVLAQALAAGGNILLRDQSYVEGDIHAHGNIVAGSANTWVDGDATAGSTITGKHRISGQTSEGAPAMTLPTSEQVLAYYRSIATEIPYQNNIEGRRLSAWHNPYGPTNPQGVYRIRCQNQNINIRGCRIAGTLIIENPGSGSSIGGGIYWEPHSRDFPALIVVGDMTFNPDTELSEWAYLRDFNLPGEWGYGWIGGVYPRRIRGVIYADGNIDVGNRAVIHGPIIATGNIIVKGEAQTYASEDIHSEPPRRFRETRLAPVMGTWRPLVPPAY